MLIIFVTQNALAGDPFLEISGNSRDQFLQLSKLDLSIRINLTT